MAEGKWEYKGFTIELTPSASFAVTIEDRYESASSLSAAKKAVDKHLAVKAEEVKLELPVLTLAFSSSFSFRDEGKAKVGRAVISGIDRENLVVEGLYEKRQQFRRSFEYVIPDSVVNEKFLQEYVALDNALKALKKKLRARAVKTHLGSSSRIHKVAYADAIKALQESYEAAKQGKSDK